jgi:hypothetical protein
MGATDPLFASGPSVTRVIRDRLSSRVTFDWIWEADLFDLYSSNLRFVENTLSTLGRRST